MGGIGDSTPPSPSLATCQLRTTPVVRINAPMASNTKPYCPVTNAALSQAAQAPRTDPFPALICPSFNDYTSNHSEDPHLSYTGNLVQELQSSGREERLGPIYVPTYSQILQDLKKQTLAYAEEVATRQEHDCVNLDSLFPGLGSSVTNTSAPIELVHFAANGVLDAVIAGCTDAPARASGDTTITQQTPDIEPGPKPNEGKHEGNVIAGDDPIISNLAVDTSVGTLAQALISSNSSSPSSALATVNQWLRATALANSRPIAHAFESPNVSYNVPEPLDGATLQASGLASPIEFSRPLEPQGFAASSKTPSEKTEKFSPQKSGSLTTPPTSRHSSSSPLVSLPSQVITALRKEVLEQIHNRTNARPRDSFIPSGRLCRELGLPQGQISFKDVTKLLKINL